MNKLKYSFLTIKAILFVSIIFILLPSCAQKSTHKAPSYLSNIDTGLHTSRPGQRIAIRTASLIDNSSSSAQEEVRIEDVSVQEQRVIGDELVATLKLIRDGEEAEIDIFGIIDSEGKAELTPPNLIVDGEETKDKKNLVHGKVECVDEYCHQIVLDIYYRDNNGNLKRHQVQSVTPELQVEVTQDEDIQQEPSPQTEETPNIETPKDKQPIVNTPPDIPEGYIKEPLSTIVTTPPQTEAIQNLVIPTDDKIKIQQAETENIRERLESGEDIESILAYPPTPTDSTTTTDEDSVQNDDFIPNTDPETEIKEAMGITVSNFLEDYYNNYGDFAYKRQAINRRSSGILKDAVLLINAVYGIKWLQHGDDHLKWVTSITNSFIAAVGKKFKTDYPHHFIIINRSSREHGGYLRPHKTHQNGLDLDIAYPNVEKNNPANINIPIKERSPIRERFWSVFDGENRFIMTEEDADITMDLLRTMSETGAINKYHVDQTVKDFLTARVASAGRLREDCPILTQLCHAGGHRNHIHVQLKCTEFNKGCHDSADPPYSTCPAPTQCQGL